MRGEKMGVIYKVTNLINKKIYIGQTIDIVQRKRNHKSDSYNINSQGYNYALHKAIRKYGWNNFYWEILEEISNDDPSIMNEREIYYITLYKSYKKGYNETFGGGGHKRDKKTFKECCKDSKNFSEEEIRDIQQMIIDGYQNHEILKKYSKLSRSLLNNINVGYNFYREDLQYPLAQYHSSRDKETQDKIIQELKDGIPYSLISEKYNISVGLLSLINNGKKWRKNTEQYPLSYKSCNDHEKGENIKKDLIFSTLTFCQIANKYNISDDAVRAICSGRNRRDNELKYPLRENCQENQKRWKN